MDCSEVTEVCRLCPSSDDLLYIFDKRLSMTYNMREIVLVTTGIEILENDIVSKKICHKCRSITLRMFQFRQDALRQDSELKEMCAKLLVRGIKIPNTCITLKKEISSTRPEDQQNGICKAETLIPTPSNIRQKQRELHYSVAYIYETYPRLKLPKKCFADNLAPVVSLMMGEVEDYFITNKLDMKKFIYRPHLRPVSTAINVAKKRTSAPLNKKIVTPLKIKKRLLCSRNNTNDNDAENELKLKRKRLNSSSLESSDKVFREKSSNTENVKVPEVIPKSKAELESPKVSEQKPKPKDSSLTDLIIPSPIESPKVSKHNSKLEDSLISKRDENVKPAAHLEKSIPTATPPSTVNATKSQAEHAESKADSSSSSNSASSAPKPEFIESLGLMPTVTTTKSHTIHICNLCGSVHMSISELKRHSHKHMVCQFCKVRFKSLESKKRHIDKHCYVKKVMNTRSIVQLEKVEFNSDIRRRYKNAFFGFPPLQMAEADIPTVVPTPILIDISSTCLDAEKEVHIEASTQNIAGASVESATPPDDIIILSDDEICDIILDSPSLTITTTPRVSEVQSTVPNSSMVKPDVRIKNNLVLNMITAPLNDGDLVKTLLNLTSSSRLMYTNKYVQTDFPSNKDIKIHHAEGTCEFKNLKEQLTAYKIPIILEFGSFAVQYIDDSTNAPKPQDDFWDDVPLFDAQDYLTCNNVMPVQNNLHTSTLLQNMTASPLNHATMKPLPATPTKAAPSVSIIQNISVSQNISFSVNYPVTSTNSTANSSSIIPVLSKSITNTKTVPPNVTVPKRAYKSTSTPGKIFSKLHSPNKSPSSAGRKSSSDNSASSSESSKFRVKNVWELQ